MGVGIQVGCNFFPCPAVNIASLLAFSYLLTVTLHNMVPSGTLQRMFAILNTTTISNVIIKL